MGNATGFYCFNAPDYETGTETLLACDKKYPYLLVMHGFTAYAW